MVTNKKVRLFKIYALIDKHTVFIGKRRVKLVLYIINTVVHKTHTPLHTTTPAIPSLQRCIFLKRLIATLPKAIAIL